MFQLFQKAQQLYMCSCFAGITARAPQNNNSMTTGPLRRFEFTWNCQDGWDEKEFSSQSDLIREFLAPICKAYLYQLERGRETGRLHYQGCLQLKDKTRKMTLVKYAQASGLDKISLRPQSTAGEMALKSYCMKKDETYVAGPWADRPLRLLQPTPNVVPLKDYDPLTKVTELEAALRPFQTTLTEVCLGVPDPRKIYWIADEAGNTGKSKWATWMRIKHGALTLPFEKANNLMNLVCEDIATNQAFRLIYIFTLPRTKPTDVSMHDIYTVLEQIKDGNYVTGKYKGHHYEGPHPHVVVLSNWRPSQEEMKCLTSDRWSLMYIDPEDYELCMYGEGQ